MARIIRNPFNSITEEYVDSPIASEVVASTVDALTNWSRTEVLDFLEALRETPDTFVDYVLDVLSLDLDDTIEEE